MSPPVELVLRFDGSTPGLADHVLSLADGKVISSVNLSARDQSEAPQQLLPRTKEVRGTVYGVTFNESTSRVKIRDSSGVIHTCRAVPEVVELAVKLRRSPVVGMVLNHKDESRLLTIREVGAPRSTMPPAERLAFLTDHWKEALKKLAE